MSVVLNMELSYLGIMVVCSAYVGLFLERGHLLVVLILLEGVMLGLFSVLLFDLF